MQSKPHAGIGRRGRTIDRRAFLRLVLAAPVAAAPALVAPRFFRTQESHHRPALLPPEAPARVPQAVPAADDLAGVASLAGGGGGQGEGQGRAMPAYSNPVVAEDCPDPGVLEDGGRYYMVSTTHQLPAFPIRVSADLVHWERTGAFVFTERNRPDWARDHFWAPELHRVSDRYVAYFTARSRHTGLLCIGAAVAETPLGPYRDMGQPLVSADVAVLDPTFFRDEDGRQYLFWKQDAPTSPSGPIFVQQLTPDGLALVGPRVEALRNDLPWEGRLVEAPAVVKRQGYYYMFYSGADYDTPDYAVGIARSTSPLGAFEKRGDPVLRGSGRWHGPGHCTLTTFQGQDYLLYHAWEGRRFRDVRPCLLDRVVWTPEGWPEVGDGHPREG